MKVLSTWLDVEIRAYANGISTAVDFPYDMRSGVDDGGDLVKAIRSRIYHRLQRREVGAYKAFMADLQEYRDALAKYHEYGAKSLWYKATHLRRLIKLHYLLAKTNKMFSVETLAAIAADAYVSQNKGTFDDFVALLLLR